MTDTPAPEATATLFYSAAEGGFYIPEIHGADIPADAVEITEAEHRALLAGQSAGQRIVADGQGRPTLQNPLADPAAALAFARGNARSRVLDWITGFLAQFVEGVPQAEIASWPTKAEAARAFVAGTATAEQTDLIQGEALLTGETPAALAAMIIARATQYTAIIARLTGLRRATDIALAAAETPAAAEAAGEQAIATANALALELL